jgi:hypothetical protein
MPATVWTWFLLLEMGIVSTFQILNSSIVNRIVDFSFPTLVAAIHHFTALVVERQLNQVRLLHQLTLVDVHHHVHPASAVHNGDSKQHLH